MDIATQDDKFLTQQLEQGLLRGEVLPYYQPKIAIGAMRVTAVEVLARWISPALGHMAAGDFIPLAERLGLIDKVNDLRRSGIGGI